MAVNSMTLVNSHVGSILVPTRTIWVYVLYACSVYWFVAAFQVVVHGADGLYCT